VTAWAPAAGDIVWVNFDPQAGREQAGHRPAVVLSPQRYNRQARLMMCVPMTTRIKGYPFEVAIAGQPPSVALVDHARSIDWVARKAQPKGRVSAAELERIRAVLRALIG
jgi:mRNA interferase MazF